MEMSNRIILSNPQCTYPRSSVTNRYRQCTPLDYLPLFTNRGGIKFSAKKVAQFRGSEGIVKRINSLMGLLFNTEKHNH